MRRAQQQLAVLAAARLRLVGVDDEVALGAGREEARLAAGREAGAAAAAQRRAAELGDQRLGVHAVDRAPQLGVAAVGLVGGDVARGRPRSRGGRWPRGAGSTQACRPPVLARASATICGTSAGLDALAVALVDRDDRRPAAAAEALGLAQRDRAVARSSRRRARRAPARRPRRTSPAPHSAHARFVHTSITCVADRLEEEHVVERGDRLAVGGREADGVAAGASSASGESQP